MNSAFTVVIPARYGSTRLAGKALLDIGGKPLIQHVYESALNTEADRVIIATDDERIKKTVDSFGGFTVMTSPDCKSGTDRVTEAAEMLKIPDTTIIINLQGDEYGCPPSIIDQLSVALYNHPEVPMATLCEKISNVDELNNPDIVKVVFNKDNSAIYFSRSSIPWSEHGTVGPHFQPFRHIGIYAYRTSFLRTLTSLGQCPLELSEKLEQLRALYYGYEIYVEEASDRCGIGIDTEADLELARKLAEKKV